MQLSRRDIEGIGYPDNTYTKPSCAPKTTFLYAKPLINNTEILTPSPPSNTFSNNSIFFGVIVIGRGCLTCRNS